MEKSDLLAERTPNRILCYLLRVPPRYLPFKGRESFVEGNTIFLKKDKSIIFNIITAKEDKWFGTPLKRNPDYVELFYNKALIYIKPLNDKQTLFKSI